VPKGNPRKPNPKQTSPHTTNAATKITHPGDEGKEGVEGSVPAESDTTANNPQAKLTREWLLSLLVAVLPAFAAFLQLYGASHGNYNVLVTLLFSLNLFSVWVSMLAAAVPVYAAILIPFWYLTKPLRDGSSLRLLSTTQRWTRGTIATVMAIVFGVLFSSRATGFYAGVAIFLPALVLLGTFSNNEHPDDESFIGKLLSERAVAFMFQIVIGVFILVVLVGSGLTGAASIPSAWIKEKGAPAYSNGFVVTTDDYGVLLLRSNGELSTIKLDSIEDRVVCPTPENLSGNSIVQRIIKKANGSSPVSAKCAAVQQPPHVLN
jgi:hypothetical protein